MGGESARQDPVSDWVRESIPHCGSGWKYFDYCLPDDFKELWNDAVVSGTEDVSGRRFVIDWSGFPTVHPLFPGIADFLTPLDWALGIACARMEVAPGGVVLPEVAIVDRCSYRHSGSFAMEMRRALVDALPRVRIFSAMGDNREDARAFVDFLTEPSTRLPPSEASVASEARVGQLRALRQAWIGYTVQSEDHHDLNNILGPLVLGDHVREDVLAAALLQLARWFQLCPKSPHSDGNGGQSLLGEELCRDPLDVLLIDDMAELGWANSVETLFGTTRTERIGSPDDDTPLDGPTGPRLIVATTPYALFPEIGSTSHPDVNSVFPLLERGGVELQVLASLPVPGVAKPADDQIVLIDLRLFSRSTHDESKFLRACLDLAIAMTDADPSFVTRWNDTRFSAKRLKCLKAAIDKASVDWEGFRRTQENLYLEVLSLFIRMLAQRYFTTPFVLFSSTGKRRILEYLRPYGNVISAFDKPRISGSAIEIDEARASLGRAVADAGRLVEFRKKLIQLLRLTLDGRKSLPEVPTGENETPPHVEIFVDETKYEEHQRFATAAVVLIYPSLEQAQRLDNNLPHLEVTQHAGPCLRWWGDNRRLTKIPIRTGGGPDFTQVDAAAPKLAQVFRQHLAICDNSKPAAFGIVVTRPARDRARDWDFDGSSHIDGLYNQMLRYLVETVVFEWLPGVLGRGDFTWGGFFPTRIRPKTQGPGNNATTLFSFDELAALQKFWGLDKSPAPGMVTTYASGSFRTLVEEIVRGRWRIGNQGASGWRGAVGVGLNNIRRRPRTIHDLADWYAFLVGTNKTTKLVGTVLAEEYLEKLGLGAEKVLAAGSYAARDDRSRALSACFSALQLFKTTTSPGDLSKMTLGRVINCVLPSLTGEDVLEVLRLQSDRGDKYRKKGTGHQNGVTSANNETSGIAKIVPPSGHPGTETHLRGDQDSVVTVSIAAATPVRQIVVDAFAENRQRQRGHRVDNVTALPFEGGKGVTAAEHILTGFNPGWDADQIQREVENAVALNGRRVFLTGVEVLAKTEETAEFECKISGGDQLARWIDHTRKDPEKYNLPWRVVRSE